MTITLNWTEINIAYRVLTGADFDHPTTTYQRAYNWLVQNYTTEQIIEALAK